MPRKKDNNTSSQRRRASRPAGSQRMRRATEAPKPKQIPSQNAPAPVTIAPANPMGAYADILSTLAKEHRLRSIPDEAPAKSIDLLSNDYLGLAEESEKYREEFFQRFPDANFTSSASRLLSRSNQYHKQLEQYL